MKAILVLEMPSSCSECPCISLGCCNAVGGVGFCRTIGDIYDRPDWCPLKPIPSKKKERYGINRQTSTGHLETYGEETDSVAVGYNACIDEILGDKE